LHASAAGNRKMEGGRKKKDMDSKIIYFIIAAAYLALAFKKH
jgi:hypothetical protein